MLRALTVFAVLLALLVHPAAAGTLNILAFGDSLTAGFGLEPGEAFPVKLEAALRARGHDVRVINAGVSGDTATAALDRLAWAVDDTIGAVIVELGANDALRGQSPAETRKALDAMLSALDQRKLPVLLAGMRAPPNLGADYVRAFEAIYPELAAAHGALLYPFFLDGVAANPKLNQADGMHPNPAGVDRVVAAMLPHAEALIARAAASP